MFYTQSAVRSPQSVFYTDRTTNHAITYTKTTVPSLHFTLPPFALSFPFHELHVRGIQIYEKLILHLKIEQDSAYPVGRIFNF